MRYNVKEKVQIKVLECFRDENKNFLEIVVKEDFIRELRQKRKRCGLIVHSEVINQCLV